MNLFLPAPSANAITSMHFYAWRKGLKTGMYYLRTQPAVDAIAFTVKSEQQIQNHTDESVNLNSNTMSGPEVDSAACSIDDEECVACSG